MRKAIEVEGITAPFPSYPVAVQAAGLLFTSGLRGGRTDFVPTSPEQLETLKWDDATGFPLVDSWEGEIAADASMVHQNLERVLNSQGIGQDQLLRQHIWQADKRFFPVYEKIRIAAQPVPCPSSGVGVGGVPGNLGRRIGLDGIAVVPGVNPLFTARETPAYNEKEYALVAYYAPTTKTGPLVFGAGNIPIVGNLPGHPLINSFGDIPEEGRFLARNRSHPDSRQGPIAAQTWFCYDQIRRMMGFIGLEMKDMLHVTVFLQDLKDFATFHRVHQHFFPDVAPTMSVMGFDEVGHRG